MSTNDEINELTRKVKYLRGELDKKYPNDFLAILASCLSTLSLYEIETAVYSLNNEIQSRLINRMRNPNVRGDA